MITSRAVVRSAYALIPATSITDNVRSSLPGWNRTRCWVLATPAIGFATAFAQYLIYLDAGGGCEKPEFEPGVESFLFVLDGELILRVAKRKENLGPGGFSFIPPDTDWSVHAGDKATAKFLWLRKAFEPIGEIKPALIINHEQAVPVTVNPTSKDKWTTNLIPVDDMAYDMHMNIVSFGPGTTISAIEAHVMEHGLYMLQGKGVYLLNEDWHEVQAGDFIWMRAFCPQAFYAGGPVAARYLLYKNVNRQFKLRTDHSSNTTAPALR
jgi:(S)-ureidoglycine aminohydrolase